MIDDTILHVLIFLSGFFLALSIVKIQQVVSILSNINDRLEYLETKILSPDEMFSELLKIKVPLKDLPPDVASQIKMEAETLMENKKIPTYVG